MPGAPDPLYVAARRTLLDALEAIRDHIEAVVLVGAQAVYVHTGEGELALAPYTTDADLMLDPAILGPTPLVENALEGAGFVQLPTEVGAWGKDLVVDEMPRRIVVDLLVPEAVGGPGRRAARIPPHSVRAARKVSGLEGALVDRDHHRVGSLDIDDTRVFELTVAGPGALLVAKTIKVNERIAHTGRRDDKDALDVLRLLQAIPTIEFIERLTRLRNDPVSRDVTTAALTQFARLFATARGEGSAMAARAAAPLDDEDTTARSAAALATDLLDAL